MISQILKRLRFFRDPIKYVKDIGVSVGDGTKIASYEFGSEPFLIQIGNNCHITKGVRFITHDGGAWVFRRQVKNLDVFGKIVIGDNVYIGNNATILPGVTIGSNVVIGANTVVTKSIPSNSVIAGNPCKFICSIEVYHEKMISHNFGTKGLKGIERTNAILSQIDRLGLKKNNIRY